MSSSPKIVELIRGKIIERLAVGALPSHVPGRMFAGYGTGKACDACDAPITEQDVEYEFETGTDRMIRLHLRCASIWEAERRRRPA